ncbi:MAG: 30S ribosomal protein S4 [Candidatus Kerfeldbacteria bacterium]|nr:30S ribosomal protein S4 [Candidatus Kerfeldbacteria bacterium]
MARKLGPKHRLCRQFGEKLCDSPKCPVVRRPYRPGQHGPKGKQRITEYGTQLREKQKAAGLYRILERQFRGYVLNAKKAKGDAGAFLIQSLEMRLDNVVYRLKFVRTRDTARQIVSHGHVMVNGKKVNIPSYQVKIGDTVSIKPKSLTRQMFVESSKALNIKDVPQWLEIVDQATLVGKVTSLPAAESLDQGFDTSLIIEFYSR